MIYTGKPIYLNNGEFDGYEDIIYECDMCGTQEDGVETDRASGQELCPKCYNKIYEAEECEK
jgi:recombinational DNA repair protein (RecF pathway)